MLAPRPLSVRVGRMPSDARLVAGPATAQEFWLMEVYPPAPAKAEILEMLSRQAEVMFGPERASALRPALEERAAHVWLVLSSPVCPDDEP